MPCQKRVLLKKGYLRIQCNTRLRMQPRSVTVDKIAGIFTKHILQPNCAGVFVSIIFLIVYLPESF